MPGKRLGAMMFEVQITIWVADLYERLSLPVLPAVVEALQKEVADRMKEVNRGKTDHKKRIQIQMKVARAEEQESQEEMGEKASIAAYVWPG